jgi:NNP family nitrate/nitrite transporter-like MFS transporter
MARWIDDWNPEDARFWATDGRRIARRNLIWSIVAENLGFSVWLLWSAIVPHLSHAGFHYSTGQLFTLVSLPGLVGAIARFPYTFAVPRFGGRNWTVVSALFLLLPTAALAWLVGRPQTPFALMAFVAASAGLGGGNFASSMANISFFYPDRAKGLVLGLNAAGGNLGVSTVQLLVPLVVAGSGLRTAGLMWLPLIAIAATGAFAFMDNLSSARADFAAQAAVVRRKQTWVLSLLYIGTFGSFVGYSAAFPLLMKTQFPGVTLPLAFLGPLCGSLSRPLGGYLADRYGGARVTCWTFGAMVMAAGALLVSVNAHLLAGFLSSFLALFLTTGIGNGSIFRMVPMIFRAEVARRIADSELAQAAARRETAAVLGISSAVGALGGFFIPRALGASIMATGGAGRALLAFVGCYVLCLLTTWWYYLRTGFLITLAPSLAEAEA